MRINLDHLKKFNRANDPETITDLNTWYNELVDKLSTLNLKNIQEIQNYIDNYELFKKEYAKLM